MRRTNIYLTDAQTLELDRLARQRGTSRAEVVRSMIDRGLGMADDDLAGDLAAIEASSGVLGDHSHLGRESDARAAHLDSLWRSAG